MKTILCGFLIAFTAIFFSASISFAALNPVTLTRNSNATDHANGVQFDDLGDWTLTVIDGDSNSLGSAGGISANNLNIDKYTSTLDFAGNSTTPGTIGPPSNFNARLEINNTGSSLGKVATFNGNVSVSTLYITTAGEMDFNGNLTITRTPYLTYTAAGTVKMADGKSILSTAITTSADNQGTLTFLGTSSVSSAIGSSTVLDLNTINANGGSGKTLTLSGTTFTDILNFGGDGTVSLADTKNLTTGTGITTSTTGTGTLTAVGTSTLAGPIGLTGARLKAVNGGATGKTTTFSNDIFAVTTNVTGSGTMALNGNLTGTTLDFNAAGATGTVNLADTKAITAAVTTQTTDTGTLTSLGTNTITGQVGTSANKLKVVNGGANGGVTTFVNDIFATTLNNTGTGTTHLQGDTTAAIVFANAAGTVDVASGKNITGAVTASGAGVGTLTFLGSTATGGNIGVAAGNGLSAVNFNAGSSTLAHDIAATTTTLNNATILTTSGTRTLTGALTLAGTSTLDVGTTTLTDTGAFTMGAGTTLKTTIGSATSFGQVVGTLASTVSATSTLNVNVTGYVPTGSTFKVIDTTGAGTTSPLVAAGSSATLSFSASTANGDTVLTATQANLGTSGNSTSVGNALNSITSPEGDMAVVLGQLQQLTSSSAVDAAYAQLDPVVNAGINTSSFNQINLSINALSQHLSETASGGVTPSLVKTGISTGDEQKNSGVWAKGYGTHANQGTRGGIAGYKANLWGVTGGVDQEVADNLRLGLASGYASTNVDNKGSDGGGTDIDSIQGTVYLNYDDPSPWYTTAGFSFNWNRYEGSRNIAFGTINRTAKSSFDGQQYTGFGEIGYVLKNSDKKSKQEWDITPLAGLTYSHLNLDSYTETEAGALNLHVNSQRYDLLQSSLGLKVERPWITKTGQWVPELHGKWLYDFIGDKFATTSTFTGGGSSFTTNGASPAKTSFDLGGGLTFYSKGNITITGTYDCELKSNYVSHTGQAVWRRDF